MALILDLVRHGHAVAAHPGGDARRALSDRGKREVGLLARGLAAGDWRPDRAFVSPLHRARQTAALLLAEIARPPDPEILERLGPDADPDEAITALAAEAGSGHVLAVSHLPLLGLLVERLTGGETHGFDPATLIRLECEDGLVRGRCRVTLSLHPAATP